MQPRTNATETPSAAEAGNVLMDEEEERHQQQSSFRICFVDFLQIQLKVGGATEVILAQVQ